MEKIEAFFLGKGIKYFISQLIGAVAAVLLLSSFQQKTHKRIVFMQACAGLLFGIQFLLIGAYEGMACNFIGMFRSFSYSFRNKSKIIDSIFCPIFFAIAFTVGTVFTYKNLFSLMPLVAMIISSFVLWIPQTQKLRALTFPTSALWLVYNFLCGSVSGVITESSCILSIIIGLIRFRKKKS